MIRRLSANVGGRLCLAGLLLAVVPAGHSQLPPAPGAALDEPPDVLLDDAGYWRLIVALSEPGGSFADENYVSNELGLQRLLPELRARYAPGGVYLGVGPEQNFSYIAALEPTIAFIIDIRRQNMLEHLLYKALFELAGDRREFLSLLFSRPIPAAVTSTDNSASLLRALRAVPADAALMARTLDAVVLRLQGRHGFALNDADLAAIEKVLGAFHAEGPAIAYRFGESDDWHPNFIQLMDMSEASGTNWSFLGSESNYARVRSMQFQNRIVPVVGDFAGPASLRAIGDYLRVRDATVDVFYVSNVEAYLFEDGLAARFYDNLASLPIDPDSVMIRTFFGSTARACREPIPALRVPFMSSIAELVADYRRGAVESVCALITRGR